MSNAMYSGEERTVQIVVTKADGSGPLDLSSYELVWAAKPKSYPSIPDSDSRTIFKTSHGSPGGITIDPDQVTNKGKAYAALIAADTNGKGGTYTMGTKLFPGAIEVGQDTLEIQRPIVRTTTAP